MDKLDKRPSKNQDGEVHLSQQNQDLQRQPAAGEPLGIVKVLPMTCRTLIKLLRQQHARSPVPTVARTCGPCFGASWCQRSWGCPWCIVPPGPLPLPSSPATRALQQAVGRREGTPGLQISIKGLVRGLWGHLLVLFSLFTPALILGVLIKSVINVKIFYRPIKVPKQK